MFKALAFIPALLLSFCAHEPSPVPIVGGSIPEVQSTKDKMDGRTAAAVTVARDSVNNPELVKRELGIALAFLPAPTPGELLYVKTRAEKADPKQYEKDTAQAIQAKEQLKDLWAKVEEERKVNAEKIAKLNKDLESANNANVILSKQIKTLSAEKALHDKEKADEIYAIASVALIALAGVAAFFSIYKAAGALAVSGFAVGAVPHLMATSYFIPALAGLLLIAVGFALWHFIEQHEKKD